MKIYRHQKKSCEVSYFVLIISICHDFLVGPSSRRARSSDYLISPDNQLSNSSSNDYGKRTYDNHRSANQRGYENDVG